MVNRFFLFLTASKDARLNWNIVVISWYIYYELYRIWFFQILPEPDFAGFLMTNPAGTGAGRSRIPVQPRFKNDSGFERRHHEFHNLLGVFGRVFQYCIFIKIGVIKKAESIAVACSLFLVCHAFARVAGPAIRSDLSQQNSLVESNRLVWMRLNYRLLFIYLPLLSREHLVLKLTQPDILTLTLLTWRHVNNVRIQKNTKLQKQNTNTSAAQYGYAKQI